MYQRSWLSLKFKWQKQMKNKKKRNSDFGVGRCGWGPGGGGLRKRPAIYVLVLCKYYMSSTFTQLFGITSTGWVYYFRNHALFMERHDLLPDATLFLSGIFFSLPSFSHSFPLQLSFFQSRSAKNLNCLSLLNNYKAERPKWRCL